MEYEQPEVVEAAKVLIKAIGTEAARRVLFAFGWDGGMTLPENEAPKFVNYVNRRLSIARPAEARDGAAKPAVIAAAPAPISTALPPLSNLSLSPDMQTGSHQTPWRFGSAELVR